MPSPKVAFDPRLDGANLFADSFGTLSQEEWTNTLIKSIENSTINGVEFPTFPPSETQNRIHGHDGATRSLGGRRREIPDAELMGCEVDPEFETGV